MSETDLVRIEQYEIVDGEWRTYLELGKDCWYIAVEVVLNAAKDGELFDLVDILRDRVDDQD